MACDHSSQAEIERKSGFVGSGKGLKQLFGQKAAGAAEPVTERFFHGYFFQRWDHLTHQVIMVLNEE